MEVQRVARALTRQPKSVDPIGAQLDSSVCSSADQVRATADDLSRPIGLIVDPERTEVRWQSEWFGRFGLADIFALLSGFTLARMIERDTFAKRLRRGTGQHA